MTAYNAEAVRLDAIEAVTEVAADANHRDRAVAGEPVHLRALDPPAFGQLVGRE
jgi:hypothetical protein